MQPEFRMLGPLEVAGSGQAVALGGVRPRRLLAMLLLHPGQVVSSDRLVDAVWDQPPASAEVTLRTHVASLRRRLVAVGGEKLLATCAGGYRLDVAGTQIDAECFERLLGRGRDAAGIGDPEEASRMLTAALELWRGEFLADLDRPPFAETAAARLDELLLAALEARVDADLSLGRHVEVVGELEALTRAHPFRERFRAQLMLALYRSDRQADALAVFRASRRLLDDELGLAPGPELTALQSAVLHHDPELAWSRPPHTESAARRAPGPALPAVFDVVRRMPMVGREHQLKDLRLLWDEVQSGGRRVALVSGEAGAGKTRLVAELATLVRSQGGTVLVGHGEQAALVPYQPVAQALHGHPDVPAALAEAPVSVRHTLARLLDRAEAVRSPSGSPMDLPEGQRSALLRAVEDLLGRVARRAPTLLVMEDAERVDRASTSLLRHVAQRLPEGVLLVLCFRDPPGSSHLPLLELLADLESHGLADRMVLDPLSERDVGSLVKECTGSPAPDAFVHALWSVTGGNPFFAREVVQDLAARNAVGLVEAVAHVPPAVRDVLRARLRALPEAVRRVVECAAVLGREVEVDLLSQVAARPSTEVVAALDEATAAGLVVEIERSGAPRYAFRHRLMLHAVGADLPATERQRLHLRAADALERLAPSSPARLAAVAVHLRAAGALVETERAAGASLRAADEVASLYAWDEAVAHAEGAVGLLAEAAAPPQRQALAALKAADLLVRQSSDLRRGIAHLHRAVELFRAAGDPVGAATARARLGHVLALHHSVMDIPAAREHLAAAAAVLVAGEAAFDVQWARSLAAMFALRTGEGETAARRAVTLASELGRPDLVAAVRPTEATHALHHGRLATARALLDEAWSSAGDLEDPHLAWEVVLAAALADNVYVLDPLEAESWCRRGLAQHRLDTVALAHEGVSDHLACALAAQGRLPAARAVASRLSGDTLSRRLLMLLSGDWVSAEREWSGALEHDLDNGDLLNATLSGCWLAEVRWLLGREDEALAVLDQAATILDAGLQVPAEVVVRAELALRLAALGDLGRAGLHLARCDRVLAQGEDWRGRAGHVELARAAVAAARGEYDRSDAAHAAALRTFTRYRLPWWRLRTLLSWSAASAPGSAAEGQDRLGEARRLLGALDADGRWRDLLLAAP